MLVLGIETTCDETAAAVVRRDDTGLGEILSNVVLSQIAEHAAFGGVVPEIAAHAHTRDVHTVAGRALHHGARPPRCGGGAVLHPVAARTPRRSRAGAAGGGRGCGPRPGGGGRPGAGRRDL